MSPRRKKLKPGRPAIKVLSRLASMRRVRKSSGLSPRADLGTGPRARSSREWRSHPDGGRIVLEVILLGSTEAISVPKGCYFYTYPDLPARALILQTL